MNINDLAAWCNVSFGNSTSNPLSYAHNLYLNGELVTELVIPDGVTKISKFAFRGCSGLTAIALPEGLTTIENYAFGYCSGFETIVIPSTVEYIGGVAFYGCDKLSSFIIDDNNPHFSLVGNALYNKDKTEFICFIGETTDYSILESVTKIGDYAFYSCPANTITLPAGVYSIGEFAFGDCAKLTSITIPNGVTSIGDYAFYYCANLTSITIPNGVTSIGDYAFYYCDDLTSVEIPNSVTSIGGNAFRHCIGLTSIEIPNSVTSIGEQAFMDCTGLTSIEIPNSVTSIGEQAFARCGLSSIYCMASTPCVLEHTLFYDDDHDDYSSVTLYVPAGSVEVYRNAEIWKKFTNIVEFDPETVGIEGVKTDDIAGKVKAENGTIVIESTVGSAMIYDMSGRMVEKVELNGGCTEITMPNKGVYVVKIGDKSVKVTL